MHHHTPARIIAIAAITAAAVAMPAFGQNARIEQTASELRDHFEQPEGKMLCPLIPAGGIAGVTNPRHYFLSEILPGGIANDSTDCGFHLGCFLDQVAGTVHDTATLIVDRPCVSRRTLVVPDRFVLAGVGLDGAGQLIFVVPNGTRALRFQPAVGAAIRHSQIRDLAIGNLNCCGQVGIDLSNSSLVQIDRVRIAGFELGIFGRVSFVNTISGSNLSNNNFGIVQGFDTTTWRMRENSISFSGQAGIVFDATTRSSVVSGGVLESNPAGAILMNGIGNVVESTWFEGNGDLAGDFAIRIAAGSQSNRILTSTFSDNDILDLGVGTSRCFNTAVGPLIPDNC